MKVFFAVACAAAVLSSCSVDPYAKESLVYIKTLCDSQGLKPGTEKYTKCTKELEQIRIDVLRRKRIERMNLTEGRPNGAICRTQGEYTNCRFY